MNVPDAAKPTATAPAGFAGIPPTVLPWVVGALLAAAICLVYGRSLHAPFVFDDHPTIPSNPSIKQLWPLWDGVTGVTPLSAPAQSATAGRPLVNLTFAVNYAIGGLNPLGYHLFNVILHILASVLLWAIVGRTLRLEYFQGRFDRAAEPLAFLVALVWALHPLQSEAVQYVTQRTELMVGLFYLATVYCSLRYFTTTVPGRRTAWCALATAACLLGMTCKEVMVTAPVMVLLFERTFVAGSFRKSLENSWRLYLGLALGWGLLLALNYGGPRSATAGFGHGVPIVAWWLTQAKVLEMYLKLAFWPWPLVLHYQMPLVTNPLQVWPSLLIVAVLGINTVVRLWWRGATGYLGAWLFVILSPTLLVPILTEYAAERRMYLPLAAIVVLVVVGGYVLLQSMAQQDARSGKPSSIRPLAITGLCALVVAGVLGVLSARRVALYNSAVTVWQDVVVHQPDNLVALSQLARELLLAGREPEANEYYQRAAAIQPGSVQRDWGLVLFQADRPAAGRAHFEEAIRLTPERAPTLRSELGIMFLKAGQPRQAEQQFEQAIELAPNSPELRQLSARARHDIRQMQETVERLRRQLEQQPNSAELHYDLASALFGVGQVAEAIAEFQRALQLQPEFPRAKTKLQQAVDSQGR